MREEKRERIDREERLVAKLSLRSTPAQLSTAPDRTALAIAAAFDVSEKTKGSERSQWQVKQKSSQQLRRQSREHRSSLVGKAEKTTQPAPRQRSPRSSVRAPRSSLLSPPPPPHTQPGSAANSRGHAVTRLQCAWVIHIPSCGTVLTGAVSAPA